MRPRSGAIGAEPGRDHHRGDERQGEQPSEHTVPVALAGAAWLAGCGDQGRQAGPGGGLAYAVANASSTVACAFLSSSLARASSMLSVSRSKRRNAGAGSRANAGSSSSTGRIDGSS